MPDARVPSRAGAATAGPVPAGAGSGARVALALFLLTVALHGGLVLLTGISPFFCPDSRMYDQMAVHVSHGEGIYYTDPYAPTIVFRSFRSPAFAILVGGIYSVLGRVPQAVVALQILLGGLLTVLVYLLTRRSVGEREGRIAGLLAVGYWRSVYFEGQLLSEILAVASFVGAIFVFQECWSRGGWKRALLSGALLGISALTRPAAIAFLPPAMLLLFFIAPRRRTETIVLALGTVAFLVPWWIRNYAVHGTFVPFLTASGPPFWDGNKFWPGTAGGDPPASGWEYLHRNAQNLSEVGIDRWIVRDAMHRIEAQPLAWIVLMVKKAFLYFDPRQRDFYAIPYRLTAPWAILGLATAVRARPKAFATVLIACASQYVFTIIFLIDLRYRYPVEIVALPLAAAGIAWVWKRLGGRAALAAFTAQALLQAGLIFVQRAMAG